MTAFDDRLRKALRKSYKPSDIEYSFPSARIGYALGVEDCIAIIKKVFSTEIEAAIRALITKETS